MAKAPNACVSNNESTLGIGLTAIISLSTGHSRKFLIEDVTWKGAYPPL